MHDHMRVTRAQRPHAIDPLMLGVGGGGGASGYGGGGGPQPPKKRPFCNAFTGE